MPVLLGKSGVNRELKEIYLGNSGINRKEKKLYLGKSGVNKQIFSSNVDLASVPTDGTVITFSNQLVTTIEFDLVVNYITGKQAYDHKFVINLKSPSMNTQLGIWIRQYYNDEEGSCKYFYCLGSSRYSPQIPLYTADTSGLQHHIKYVILSNNRMNAYADDELMVSEYSIYTLTDTSPPFTAMSCQSILNQIPITITNLVIK